MKQIIILEDKVVTTRKEHHCWGCSRKFPKGSRLFFVKSVEDGVFGSVYWCKTCGALPKVCAKLGRDRMKPKHSKEGGL